MMITKISHVVRKMMPWDPLNNAQITVTAIMLPRINWQLGCNQMQSFTTEELPNEILTRRPQHEWKFCWSQGNLFTWVGSGPFACHGSLWKVQLGVILACWDFLAAAPIKFLPILQSLSPRIQASLTRRAVGNTCARVVYKYVASCDGADTCVWRGN